MLIAILAATVVSAAAPGGAGPGVPGSSVRIVGPTQLRYCVTNYAPSAAVKVTEATDAAATGTAATIHTNNKGAGCTQVPFSLACGDDGPVVATGIGADGNPATSSVAVADAAGAPSCTPTATAHHTLRGGGLSNFAVGLLIGVLGAVVVAGIGILFLTRRRSA